MPRPAGAVDQDETAGGEAMLGRQQFVEDAVAAYKGRVGGGRRWGRGLDHRPVSRWHQRGARLRQGIDAQLSFQDERALFILALRRNPVAGGGVAGR